METSHILLELYVSLLSQKKHDDMHSSPRRMIPPVTLRGSVLALGPKSCSLFALITSMESLASISKKMGHSGGTVQGEGRHTRNSREVREFSGQDARVTA